MPSDASRDSRAPRRARPRQSLKMQAIGFLSRREHSRQELRAKLLDSLRKRAREDAALAVAAEELVRAAQAQPSNGIDDAFAPRTPELALAGGRAQASRAGALARAGGGGSTRAHASTGTGTGTGTSAHARVHSSEQAGGHLHRPSRSAIDTLALANGAALPSRLRASLVAAEDQAADGTGIGVSARPTDGVVQVSDDPPDDADLERDDPEAAVDQLLDWLAAHRYLSDERFVESRVNARSRKQGTLRIKLELSRHGLALEPAQAAVLRETEFARAQALWQRKFGEVATDPKGRAKQARFLAARGFAADVVRRVVGGEEEF